MDPGLEEAVLSASAGCSTSRTQNADVNRNERNKDVSLVASRQPDPELTTYTSIGAKLACY